MDERPKRNERGREGETESENYYRTSPYLVATGINALFLCSHSRFPNERERREAGRGEAPSSAALSSDVVNRA